MRCTTSMGMSRATARVPKVWRMARGPCRGTAAITHGRAAGCRRSACRSVCGQSAADRRSSGAVVAHQRLAINFKTHHGELSVFEAKRGMAGGGEAEKRIRPVVNGQYGLWIQVAHGCNVRQTQVGDHARRTCPAAASPSPGAAGFICCETGKADTSLDID